MSDPRCQGFVIPGGAWPDPSNPCTKCDRVPADRGPHHHAIDKDGNRLPVVFFGVNPSYDLSLLDEELGVLHHGTPEDKLLYEIVRFPDGSFKCIDHGAE